MRRVTLLAAALAGLVFVALVLVALVFVVFPDMFAREAGPDFSPADEQKARADVRTSALALLGGATLAVGAYLTWRSVRTARESNEIARSGQMTDRFTKAVEQLASDSLTIRLGGIYALEQIARVSPRDREPLKQLLTALIHERASRARFREGAPRAGLSQHAVQADVQAALTVLGRRESEPSRTTRFTDLEGLELVGADLSTLRLDGFNLSDADLTRAKLAGIEQGWEQMPDGQRAPRLILLLRGAKLEGAIMVEADLRFSDLRGADLTDAVLVQADLTEARLQGATLRHTDLTEADLTGANLSETKDLESAQLFGVKSNGAIWPVGFTHTDSHRRGPSGPGKGKR
jgi:uncharacterized protein YjbI with pentapeptide repeats